jgi:hypothetical protein
MPKLAQGVILLAMAGGIFAAASMFQFGKALAVFVAGVALVGLLLLGYQQLLKFLATRRSMPMEQAIRDSAGAAPVGIAEPARRARLDDLRKNFEAGVQKFRDSGKNLYSLPWYLLVGEPGSGKTEAIRHCNVGFPPGLQDQLQGAGGTLNMNWWFTNHAVILDTAGRLMFEEIEPGTTGEWQEFLKLMRRSRPNCPVNGMMLVIPSESLIRDSAEAIEQKGGKIAQQLDNIQRALGVRFPVYVVVTKCDLINGFREFFDGIADPGLQHQIMGWSNPASLDTPFDPEAVDQHLAVVKQRLVRRRMGLLQDPVNTEDPRARRTDQVDALYEFPDAFMDVAPRLKRYLQMIFVAGEWSAKPLFLRGIYFSSSMREGEALDAKLADALGVSVESLPEGKVWDRDKSYFLRDLFMSKMFREKGLVTRATNTGQQQRARRNLLYGASFAGLAALAAFTYFGFTQLKRDIVEPATFWSAVGGAMQKPSALFPPGKRAAPEADPEKNFAPWAFPVVTYIDTIDAFGYRGDAEAELTAPGVAAEARQRARLPGLLKAEAERRIAVPWIYYPAALVSSDASGDLARHERMAASRAVFEAAVLRPLVDATRSQFRADAAAKTKPAWTPEATAALAQLLRLEAGSVSASGGAGAGGGKSGRPMDLAAMIRFLMVRSGATPEKIAAAESDAGKLQEVLKGLYLESDEVGWPPSAEALPGATGDELRTFAGMFAERAGQAGGGAASGSGAMDLIAALRELDAAERALQELGRGGPDGPGAKPLTEWSGEWSKRYGAVSAAAGRLDGLAPALAGGSLAQSVDKARAEMRVARTKSVDAMLEELAPAAAAGSHELASPVMAARVKAIGQVRETLESMKTSIAPAGDGQGGERAEVASLDAKFIAGDAWKKRAAMYALADKAQTGAAAATSTGDGQIADDLIKLKADTQLAIEKGIDAVHAPGDDKAVAAVFADAKEVCRRRVRAGAARTCGAIIDRMVTGSPSTVGDLQSRVAALAAKTEFAPPARPALPLTHRSATFAPEYSPKAAAAVLRDYFAVIAALGAGGSGEGSLVPAADRAAMVQKFAKQATAARGYLDEFADYWTEGLTADGGAFAISADSWANFREGVAKASTGSRSLFDEAVAAVGEASSAASSLESLVASDDKPVRDAIARVQTCLTESRNSLKDRRRRPLEEMAGRWGSLNADAGAARETLGQALRQTGTADRFYEPPPDADGYDVVIAYFNRLSVTGFEKLAADQSAHGDDVFASLRPLHRFPLKAWGEGVVELTPEEVDKARTLLARVRVPESGTGAGSLSGAGQVWPQQIGEPIRVMFGGAQAGAEDLALAREMSERIKLIPEAGKPSTVSVVYIDDPGRAIDGHSVKSRAALRLSGERVRNGGVISRDGTRKLGEVPIASGEVAIELFTDAAGRQLFSRQAFPTRWFPLYLLDRFPSMPLAQTPSVVEPQIRFKPDNDEEYGMILRLEFPLEMKLPAP